MEWEKLIELMKVIRTGNNIVFDNSDGVFKITKLEEAPIIMRDAPEE